MFFAKLHKSLSKVVSVYKNFLFFIAVFFFACSQQQDKQGNSQQQKESLARGAVLYKQCIICHGEKAEKSYMGDVPPIQDIEIGARTEIMKAYRDGTLGEKGIYGLADLKGEVMLNLSDQDMQDIDFYIQFLKEQSK